VKQLGVWIVCSTAYLAAGCQPPTHDDHGATQPTAAAPPAATRAATPAEPPATTPAMAPAPPVVARKPKVSAPSESVIKLTVAGNTRFALDLYGLLSAQPGNLFFSPYSISSALAMTWSGARGATADEMADTMHYQHSLEEVASVFANLNETLTGSNTGYELRIANRLWGQNGYEFAAEFLALARDYYGAPLATVDFAGATEAARTHINDWVAEQTNDKIENLVPPNAIDNLTRLVLTNAIYFKGSWVRQFDPAATRDAPFRLTDGGTQTAPMMYQEARFGYARHDGMQLLRLPYEGRQVSMIVLLPDAADGLPSLEASLNADQLAEWMEDLKEVDVQVYVPRFEMSSQFSLRQALVALGIETAFDAKRADFSPMLGRRELYISAAVHKAFVEVNEEGTEAAAATAVMMGIESVREVPVFRADHPFVFLIHDARTDSILFVGRLSNPQD